MIELRQFFTPPEWTHSDLTGMLNPACHITITYAAVDTDTGTVIGKPGRHRAVVAQQGDGTWAFAPWPVQPHNGKPFVFAEGEVERLIADIEGDVLRRGVVPVVLTPTDNGNGTVTVTAAIYEEVDGKYARVLKAHTTSRASPDLSALADVLAPELLAAAKAAVLAGNE